VPVWARRAARHALQLARAHPKLNDRSALAALWTLCLPPLEPAQVAPFRSNVAGPEPDDAWAYADEEGNLRPEDDAVLRGGLRRLFARIPRSVLTHLAAADAAEPATPIRAVLGESLGLDETALPILAYLIEYDALIAYDAQGPLRALLRRYEQTTARVNLMRRSAALAIGESALREALSRQVPLRRLALLDYTGDPCDLGDFIRPTSVLRELLDAEPTDANALLAILIEPRAFPHLADAVAHLQAVLARAATTGAIGVNALLHGAPGTGKTELARAIADAGGLRAYRVRSADEDDDGLWRAGRLSAYLLAQRLLARRRDALLIFDEVEDVLDTGDDLLALLRGRSTPGHQKGWMNRTLEDNPVPAIWITSGTDAMDPSFLRRFLLPVACTTPPRSVRRRIAESHLGDCGLPPALLDELADDAALAPAQLGAARRLLELRPETAQEPTVRHGLAAMRSLLHGSPTPRRRRTGIDFDVAFLNLAGGIAPSAIVQAFDRTGRGSICFYGPPGTGKTAFAEILDEALDRELIARRASDLLYPYVGETEQNLARLFRESDPAHSLLLLDEVGSFLGNRRQAHHSWERTQVNELLQQMEQYPGIFVAATNLMPGIEPAALRRFDFKLHFRALPPAQRLALFDREALGDTTAPVPADVAQQLAELETLTPGDFATVARQRTLLGETLTPEQFLRRLAASDGEREGSAQCGLTVARGERGAGTHRQNPARSCRRGATPPRPNVGPHRFWDERRQRNQKPENRGDETACKRNRSSSI
jgi:SpoVK/Ycf46/Vps4 family AAA+-type ATPase